MSRSDRFLVHTTNFTTQRVHLGDASDGSLPADSFSVQTPQFFDVFNGDIEVYEGGGVLVVGSGTSAIRAFSRGGEFLGDIGLGHLGITDLSGIAIHPTTGGICLSTDSSAQIHRLPKPGIVPTSATGVLGLASLVAARRRA